MWVKNQDKTRLVETKEFEIEKMGKINEDGIWESSNGCRIRDDKGFVIAIYSSKEKAMKVLEMIEELINLTEEYRTQGEDVIGSKSPMARKSRLVKFVFQMPQDEEVE